MTQIANLKLNKKLQDKADGNLKALQLKSEDNNQKLNEVKEKIKEEQEKITSLTKEIINLKNKFEIYDKKMTIFNSSHLI